jgi:uncharacterized membrane protein (UPF0127 family)
MSRAPHFLMPLLERDGPLPALVLTRTGQPLASHVESALDSASRKRGLLGRASMGADSALIIAPCNGVHTFRMQFAIDVIYVARDGRVMKLRPAMVPGRVSFALGAFATIEMAAGAIERADLRPGDMLELR